MAQEQAPEWFIRGLISLDSCLHVRWGSAIGKWVVDRDGLIPDSELQFLTRRLARAVRAVAGSPDDIKKIAFRAAITEELLSAKAGRRVILYTNTLDRRIFEQLMLRDIQRYGGYARAILELESSELAAQKAIERQQSSHNIDLGKELYDQLNFVERKKQNELNSGYTWKELLASGRSVEKPTGNVSLGEFAVVDKRRVVAEPAEVAV